MRLTPRLIGFFTLASALSLASPEIHAAEKLSDILREHNWDGIIGKWGDAETGGKSFTVSYVWKIEDRLIETTTEYEDRESVALMGVNANSGEVFHMGADSDGGSSLGKWEVDDQGDAILGLVFTGGDGEQGAMSIRHRRVDDDTIVVTIELPEPITIRLIRLTTDE